MSKFKLIILSFVFLCVVTLFNNFTSFTESNGTPATKSEYKIKVNGLETNVENIYKINYSNYIELKDNYKNLDFFKIQPDKEKKIINIQTSTLFSFQKFKGVKYIDFTYYCWRYSDTRNQMQKTTLNVFPYFWNLKKGEHGYYIEISNSKNKEIIKINCLLKKDNINDIDSRILIKYSDFKQNMKLILDIIFDNESAFEEIYRK